MLAGRCYNAPMRLDHLDQLLRNQCHLSRNQAIVVGVSGGPDSLCLVDALYRLGYPVIVAHFDHQLRTESSKEAGYVREFARERELPFELASLDVAAFARKNNLSVEEAARISRYRFLFATARQLHARAVAVGHTADDQVETVLMHLLRGAGLAGLKGMRLRSQAIEWDVNIPLLRPLLENWREETLEYCATNGLKPVFDPSNQDPTYFRNRIRQELIPYLQKYNPRVREALLRSARALANDYDLLQETAAQAWDASMVEHGEGFVAFDFDKVQSFSPGMQSNLLRQAITRLRPTLRDFDFAAIEHALQYIADPKRTNQCDLAVGLRLALEGSHLYLADWSADLPSSDWPQLEECEVISFAPGSRVALRAGWVLCSQVLTVDPGETPFAGEAGEAWLDLDTLRLPLRIRVRRLGERFQPLGMPGKSIKLSDFFVNIKLPQRARAAWPLVCSGDAIAWIPGYRLGHPFRVQSGTRRVLRLQLLHTSKPER
ncbi:MAG: tRNA lysidine(34) synthetase TilS [Anaerolineaceae bacterium]|nr:tRNA lysidine(34) synthetase TilS [Anaerolineaceae bacterium]